MLIESLESRTFMSCTPHTVTLPIIGGAYGNLPANHLEGYATTVGHYTGAFNAQGLMILTTARGEIWVQATLIPSEDNAKVWTVTGNYVGGTGFFAGASGPFTHPLYFIDDKGDFWFPLNTRINVVVPCTGAGDPKAVNGGGTSYAVFNGGRGIEELSAPASNTATSLLLQAA